MGSTNTSIYQVNGNGLNATVFYDILQKLTAGVAGAQVNPVLLSKWTNTNAYAPMYEVPANGQRPDRRLRSTYSRGWKSCSLRRAIRS